MTLPDAAIRSSAEPSGSSSWRIDEMESDSGGARWRGAGQPSDCERSYGATPRANRRWDRTALLGSTAREMFPARPLRRPLDRLSAATTRRRRRPRAGRTARQAHPGTRPRPRERGQPRRRIPVSPSTATSPRRARFRTLCVRAPHRRRTSSVHATATPMRVPTPYVTAAAAARSRPGGCRRTGSHGRSAGSRPRRPRTGRAG